MTARISRINPDQLHETPGYHHITVVEAGRTAWTVSPRPGRLTRRRGPPRRAGRPSHRQRTHCPRGGGWSAAARGAFGDLRAERRQGGPGPRLAPTHLFGPGSGLHLRQYAPGGGSLSWASQGSWSRWTSPSRCPTERSPRLERPRAALRPHACSRVRLAERIRPGDLDRAPGPCAAPPRLPSAPGRSLHAARPRDYSFRCLSVAIDAALAAGSWSGRGRRESPPCRSPDESGGKYRIWTM